MIEGHEIRDVADKDYNGHFVKNAFLFSRYLRLTFSNMCDERVLMRSLFRDVSSWLLLIGIAVSFFGYLNADTIYQNVQQAMNEVNEYRYRYTYQVIVEKKSEEVELNVVAEEMPGTVIATADVVYMNKVDEYRQCEVLIKCGDPLPWPIEEQDSEGLIYIGNNLLKECEIVNGKMFLMINGESLPVKGVISSKKSDILNNKIVFLYEAVEYTGLNDNEQLILEIGSERYEYENELQRLVDKYSETMNIWYEKIDKKYISVGGADSDAKFFEVISIFAIINCIVISEFWILRRKREIIISRLFGYGTIKLIARLYGMILLITLFSVILVFAFQTAAVLFVPMKWKLSGHLILVSFVYLLISSFLLSVFPVWKAVRFKMGDGTVVI